MAEVKLILSRDKLPSETLGTYYVMQGYEELYKCRCVELPWLNNKKNMSCIPDGVYECIKISTKKHPNSFLIKDVPNRSAIMIHIANFTYDLAGCQAAGLQFKDIDSNGIIDVSGSKIAMQSLNHFLPDKFNIYIL